MQMIPDNKVIFLIVVRIPIPFASILDGLNNFYIAYLNSNSWIFPQERVQKVTLRFQGGFKRFSKIHSFTFHR